MDIDIGNRFAVGVKGDEIVIALPVRHLSKDAALVYAAWIVALADRDDKFPAILEAVRNT